MPGSQRVSANAIRALKDALSSIFWFKRDLLSYAKAAVKNDATFLAGIEWTELTKRESVDLFVDRLVRLHDDHPELLLHVLVDVASFNDFSGLQRTDDPKQKTAEAKAAVQRLAAQVKPYEQALLEQEKTIERIRGDKQRAQERRATTEQLQRLKDRFIELHTAEMTAQKRGYAFEGLLCELFDVYDLNAKASYKVDGEQIDGAFTLDSEHFLLEAKWEKDLIGRDDVDVFQAKIERKADFTRGLFLAVNGFAQSAIDVHSRGGARFVLADGADLLAILEERVGLPDALRTKLRHVATTGEVMKRL